MTTNEYKHQSVYTTNPLQYGSILDYIIKIYPRKPLEFIEVQQQPDGRMWGFFTISLALQENLANKVYVISEMQNHGGQLLSNAIIPFPILADSTAHLPSPKSQSEQDYLPKASVLKAKLYPNPLKFYICQIYQLHLSH